MQDHPAQLQDICARHHFEIVERLSARNSFVVARVRVSSGHVAILKFTQADRPERREAKAMKLWQETSLVPASYEIEPGVLLLDDLGGEALIDAECKDEYLVQLGRNLKVLHKYPTEGFAPLKVQVDRVQGLIEGEERISYPTKIFAQERYSVLLNSSLENKLLHGDFYSGNVLIGEDRELHIIDPYGFVGDGAYDLAKFACCQADHQEKALSLLLEGYGEELPRMQMWFEWMAVARLMNALTQLGPQDIINRQKLVDRRLETTV